MKIHSLFILFLFVGLYSFVNTKQPRKNYLKDRERYTLLICEKQDSLTAIQTIRNLLAIDSSIYTKNFHYYYEDLAWAYYIYYAHTKDKLYIKKAIENYHKVVDITKDYWNIAFCYILLGDYENGCFYLGNYKANTKKKNRMEASQLEALEAKCR
jgi:tetratricopeptide (TPR) repeat protein